MSSTKQKRNRIQSMSSSNTCMQMMYVQLSKSLIITIAGNCILKTIKLYNVDYVEVTNRSLSSSSLSSRDRTVVQDEFLCSTINNIGEKRLKFVYRMSLYTYYSRFFSNNFHSSYFLIQKLYLILINMILLTEFKYVLL